jgi:hypothetical protein
MYRETDDFICLRKEKHMNICYLYYMYLYIQCLYKYRLFLEGDKSAKNSCYWEEDWCSWMRESLNFGLIKIILFKSILNYLDTWIVT